MIRDESEADAAAIESVTVAAFTEAPRSTVAEHRIVSRLREDGALAVSLVAEQDGEIVGHVAISPVTISDGSTGWFGLGPVSVTPAQQGCGIGSRLIRAALDRLRAEHAAGCVVLGEPGYYARFGFELVPGLELPGVPPGYFQVLAFGTKVPRGTVTYHEAFSIDG